MPTPEEAGLHLFCYTWIDSPTHEPGFQKSNVTRRQKRHLDFKLNPQTLKTQHPAHNNGQEEISYGFTSKALELIERTGSEPDDRKQALYSERKPARGCGPRLQLTLKSLGLMPSTIKRQQRSSEL